MTLTLTKKQAALLPHLGRQGTKHTLVYGGSRSGKTFLTCYAIATRALRAEGSRHGIFRKHAVAVKQSVGRDTFPKVMSLAYPDAKFKWYEQDGVFVFGTGSEVWCAGLDDKERVDKVLGKEYATIYENEASELSYDAHTTLMTRLAQNVQANVGHPGPLPLRNYVDLNPTTQSHWTYKLFVQGVDPESKRPINRGDYSHFVANPMDNERNLPPDYLESLKYLPEAKRKRFFLGEFSGDAEDALWTRASIERLFVMEESELPDFIRIVVAIDPAASSEPGSDETGIVVCAIDKEGYGYVLEDASGVMKPEDWAMRAVSLYNYYKADCIVAEKNQGGEMVESTIQAQAKGRWVPVKLVHASRGKVTRAEPISALYARRRVRHVREFAELEDQMCLAAGTLIETHRGQVPIERVRAGDFVMTRAGYCSVKIARETGCSSEFVVIETTDGRTLKCTTTHPIFNPETGQFVAAKNVKAGMLLSASRNWGSMAGLSHGAGDGITAWQAGITAMQRASYSTGRFGKRIAARSLADAIYITLTAIRGTTASIISKLSRPLNMWLNMSRGAFSTSTIALGAATQSRFGMRVSGMSSRAFNVASRAAHRGRAVSSAMTIAGGSTEQSRASRIESAPVADNRSGPKTRADCIAVKRATTLRTTSESVYNLEVDGLPEYYANGILTHNCSFTTGFDRKTAGYSPDRVDALVWGFTELFPGLIEDRSNAAPQYATVEPDAPVLDW